MQEKLNACMKQYDISFHFLSQLMGLDKHTLTKKMKGELDWTFPEMERLIELFQIEDPMSFFYES